MKLLNKTVSKEVIDRIWLTQINLTLAYERLIKERGVGRHFTFNYMI